MSACLEGKKLVFRFDRQFDNLSQLAALIKIARELQILVLFVAHSVFAFPTLVSIFSAGFFAVFYFLFCFVVKIQITEQP